MAASRLLRYGLATVLVLVTWAAMISLSHLFEYSFHRDARPVTKVELAPATTATKVLAPTVATKRSQKPTPPQPKNVLLIVTDDLRPQLGLYGHPETRTPNLDAFAKRSMVFDAAYCQVPSCNPSRNSFLSGRSPFQSRIFFFEGDYVDSMGEGQADTVFHHFRRQGYIALGVGKIFHASPAPAAFSPENGGYFPEDYNQEWGYVNKRSKDNPEPANGAKWTNKDLRSRDARYYGCDRPDVMSKAPWDNTACFRNGFVYVEDAHPLHFFDNRVTKIALGSLDDHVQAHRTASPGDEAPKHLNPLDRPFILGVGFHDPHFKWHIPADLWALYRNETLIRAPRQAAPVVGVPLHSIGDFHLGNVQLHDGREFVSPVKEPRETMLRGRLADVAAIEMRRAYSTAVTHVDRHVGDLLGALENHGLTQSTIVVFTADHGFGLGEASHWGKGSVHEIDARVPLIVHDPTLPQSHGQRTSKLVELLDLYPSLVDLAAPRRGDFEAALYRWSPGHSWRPLLEHPQGNNWPRDFALTIITACFFPGEHSGKYSGGCCKGKSYTWDKFVDKTMGPKAPLLGFGLRSDRYRYIAWLVYNSSNDDVNWKSPPYSEELYDYEGLHAAAPDFDAWTELPNLLYPSPRDGVHRDTADRHLAMLRDYMRTLREKNGHWGYWRIVRRRAIEPPKKMTGFSFPSHPFEPW